jgi:thiamine-phosphate pyrophosphorylase
MLIVFTSENHVDNEGFWLNELFDHGLETLHVRKPKFTREAYQNLLQEIRPEYHHKIMIHQNHEFCLEMGLKGIHIPEYSRKMMSSILDNYVNGFQSKNYSVSSSFHNLKAVEQSDSSLDYYVLSPVFSSISKSNYLGKEFDVHHISKSIIGLGGIQSNNISQVQNLGYNGIAVLGSIWQSKNPLQNYIELQNKYQSTWL